MKGVALYARWLPCSRISPEFLALAFMSKTVAIHLFDVDLLALRSSIAQVVPWWGQIGIKFHARDLGFEVGPGREEFSWRTPFRKFCERVDIWKAIGAGHRLAVAAYRVYIITVRLFVAQLERVPAGVLQQ
ncbi:unnamed protein product [Prorocentrum cordatum]|uniref:Uncharacterized protein n=1 Tax=Prorocentrum cordatum TaxID=2364126 RepID=A0ABN9U6Z8_9DINO|nr:unnamed protein product [Polarella glacialis]